jgi:Helicase conserved C-terminal domain/Zinc finger, C3HC4 type (RING finger)
MSQQERKRRLCTYLKGVFTNEIEEAIDPIPQPTYIKKTLYLHQRALVKSCRDLEMRKFTGLDCSGNRTLYSSYGIISDRVGSGKSLVALTLAKYPAPDDRVMATTYLNSSISMISQNIAEPHKRRVRAALFIIPHVLMSQWEEYVIKDTTLETIFCRRRKEVADRTIMNFLDTVDAVFVSSTMWKEFDTLCKPEQIQWSRIFIDEADTIVAPILPTLTGNFIWLITASYLNIAFPTGLYLPISTLTTEVLTEPVLDRIKSIWPRELRIAGTLSNSHFIHSLLKAADVYVAAEMEYWRITKRNSDKFVDASFQMPPIYHKQIICRSTTNIRILDSIIPTEVMDMLHAGDTRGALQALGVHDESPTKIMESLTRSMHKELEQLHRKLEFNKTLDYSSDLAKTRSLESLQQRIASLESRIETIETRMTNYSTQNCPICYGDVETPALTPCCKNLFCFACLCESMKRQPGCPLCRVEIRSINEIHVLNKDSNTICEPDQPRTKLEEFIQFVELNPAARTLLFSSYDASLFHLMSEMNIRNIRYTTINGSTQRVSKIINEFAEGNYQVLLLNSKCVGAGLNIVSATDVFLFHKMNAELEKQIIGRAYRTGRTAPLNVHHLLHQNEQAQV